MSAPSLTANIERTTKWALDGQLWRARWRREWQVLTGQLPASSRRQHPHRASISRAASSTGWLRARAAHFIGRTERQWFARARLMARDDDELTGCC